MMLPLPLTELAITAPEIRLLASDVDGTLTQAEKFTPRLLAAMLQLQQAGIPLILVTGRSMGWVDALRHYLPIAGAIAENGGVYFPRTGPAQILSPIPDSKQHRQQLLTVFTALQQEFPELQTSADNRFRLTDWTFDLNQLSEPILQAITARLQDWGWSFTYSTVQCHIKPAGQDKAIALWQVIHQHYPQLQQQQVMTIGDSPNDQSLFDPQYFSRSVGVANLLVYRDRLLHLPKYLTHKSEGEGFCELVDYLSAITKGHIK